MTHDKNVSVELVYGTAQNQVLIEITVPDGTSIGEAIERSAIADLFPGEDFGKLPAGVWGKMVDRNDCVAAGDRIELYRALQMDPRDARRELAAAGRTMGTAESDRR